MQSRSLLSPVAALALAGTLSACATGPKPVAALTTVSTRECAPAPDFMTATALVLDPKKETTLTIDIADTAPCLKTPAGVALYRVFALPPADVPYVLNVASVPAGTTLFAPHVMLVASDGTVRRDYAGQAIEFRSNGFGMMARSHSDETYLVLASDPRLAGNTTDRFIEATQVTTGSTGYATFQIHTGSESVQRYTFAHNGEVIISLTPLLPAK